MYGPKWPFLLMYGSHDMRRTSFSRVDGLSTGPPGIWCKTRENYNFLKNGKMVISVKIRNFSRSWMTKWTSPLESSREI